MAYRTVSQRCMQICQDECPCLGTPLPGHLLEFVNSSGVKKVQVHSVAGGNAAPIFAMEDELQGRGIATAYTAGTNCMVRTFQSGDLVAARVATAQTLAFGT